MMSGLFFFFMCAGILLGSMLPLARKKQTQLPSLQAEQWRTVAVYREDKKFTDSKKPYSITFVFKVSDRGNRKVDPSATPPSQALHVLNHHRQDIFYLAYIIPWVEGTLTLEETAKALGKELTVIPVQV